MAQGSCSSCGKPVYLSTTSASNPVCRPCRRQRRAAQQRYVRYSESATCAVCGTLFAKRKADQKRCSPCARKDAKPQSASDRGYGTQHQAERRAWQGAVSSGQVSCCLCGQPIAPGSAWDLDHLPGTTEYRGPAHAACNRRDGAHRRNRDPSKPVLARACQTCGTRYTTTRPDWLWCSRPCKPKPKRRRRVRPSVATEILICVCGQAYTGGAAYCSTTCAARSAYRAKAGIPLDSPKLRPGGPGRPRRLPL